jgi:hypothetical protein
VIANGKKQGKIMIIADSWVEKSGGYANLNLGGSFVHQGTTKTPES